jgi:hypothetical protein
MEIDRGQAVSLTLERPVSSPIVSKRVPARAINGFDTVRRNIGIQSRGIFSPPARERNGPTTVSASNSAHIPELPSRSDFAHISRSYLDSIHEAYPILYWPTFQAEIDQAYTERDLRGFSQEWIGLFFAALACGHLNLPANSSLRVAGNGYRFYDIAAQIMTPWPQELAIIHVQTRLLLSLYAMESNMKPAGSMWLASGIRVAQLLALNVEDETKSLVEAEIRRRLWWALYVRDRSVATLSEK